MFAFRSEVLAARRSPPLAEAVEWLPRSARRWAWLVALAFVVLVVLLAQAPLRERVSVGGHVVATRGSTPVFAPMPGLVANLSVIESQRVTAGQPLFDVVRERTLAPGRTDARLLREQLEHQQAALQAAHRDAAALHEQRRRGIDAQARQLSRAERLLRDEQQLANGQLAAARRQHEARAQLARAGVLPRLEFERSTQEFGAQRRQQLTLQRELAATLERAAGNEVARAGLEAGWRAEQMRYRLEASRLEAERTRLRGESRVVVTAPVSGRVSGLDLRIGQRVEPAAPLLTLEPPDREHAVELLLPSSAAGRARPGMAVRLHYSGYPQRRYGSIAGRIERITATPVIQVTDRSSLRSPEAVLPFYRARVRVEDPRVDGWSLRSGMTVQAELLLDSRPVWRWVLEPVRGWLEELR